MGRLRTRSKWCKYVPDVQRAINSTYNRSVNRTPFELMIGTRMRCKTDLEIRELIEEEDREFFEREKDECEGANQKGPRRR